MPLKPNLFNMATSNMIKINNIKHNGSNSSIILIDGLDKNLYYVFNLFIVLDKYNVGTCRIKYYLFINL